MNSGDATLAGFGTILHRRIRLIACVAGPMFAIFIGIAVGWPSVYRSTGVIRLAQQQTDDNNNVDTYAEYFIETLTGQVFTKANLDQWVNKFDLYANHKSWTDTEKAGELLDNLDTKIVTTLVIDPRSGRDRDVVTGFEVYFDSKSPDEAKDVATDVTNAFLAENRRSRQAKGQKEIEFFNKEAEGYRGQIAEVEKRLADFKERNSRRLPELMQLNLNAMDRVERDIDSTQMQIDNLKRERVILQTQLSQIPSTSDEAIKQLAALQNEYVRVSSIYQDNHPDVVSIRKQIELLSQSVDSAAAIPLLKEQEEHISNELAEARKKYSEDHPDVKRLERSESAIKDRIAALEAKPGGKDSTVVSANDLYVQLDTQVKGIDSQLSGLTGRIADLRKKQTDYEKILMETPEVEREFQDLSRDLANARQLYEETKEKQRKAELSLALAEGSSKEQLELAQPPQYPDRPAWPPRAAIVLLGLILATGFGVAAATIREITSVTVRSSRDAQQLSGVPPLALIPIIRNRADRVASRMQNAGFATVVVVIGVLAFVGAQSL